MLPAEQAFLPSIACVLDSLGQPLPAILPLACSSPHFHTNILPWATVVPHFLARPSTPSASYVQHISSNQPDIVPVRESCVETTQKAWEEE